MSEGNISIRQSCKTLIQIKQILEPDNIFLNRKVWMINDTHKISILNSKYYELPHVAPWVSCDVLLDRPHLVKELSRVILMPSQHVEDKSRSYLWFILTWPVTISPKYQIIWNIWFLIGYLHQSFCKLNYANLKNLWNKKITYIGKSFFPLQH